MGHWRPRYEAIESSLPQNERVCPEYQLINRDEHRDTVLFYLFPSYEFAIKLCSRYRNRENINKHKEKYLSKEIEAIHA